MSRSRTTRYARQCLRSILKPSKELDWFAVDVIALTHLAVGDYFSLAFVHYKLGGHLRPLTLWL